MRSLVRINFVSQDTFARQRTMELFLSLFKSFEITTAHRNDEHANFTALIGDQEIELIDKCLDKPQKSEAA